MTCELPLPADPTPSRARFCDDLLGRPNRARPAPKLRCTRHRIPWRGILLFSCAIPPRAARRTSPWVHGGAPLCRSAAPALGCESWVLRTKNTPAPQTTHAAPPILPRSSSYPPTTGHGQAPTAMLPPHKDKTDRAQWGSSQCARFLCSVGRASRRSLYPLPPPPRSPGTS